MNLISLIRNKEVSLVDFFFLKNQKSSYALSFFRIAVGLLVLLHFLAIAHDFQKLFGKYGIIPWDITELFTPTYLITLPKIITFFESYGLSESQVIYSFSIVFILICVLLTIGLFTRLSALLLLVLQISIVKGGPLFAYGVDFFTSMSLFYLLIAPSNQKFSIDSLLFKSKGINPVPYHRLLQIHLCIAYFFSGLDKVIGFNWWNGESIWKAINLPYVNGDFNIDFTFFAEHPFIPITIGWATIIIEMLYPLFIWIKQTRKVWLFLTISMHVGIAVIFNLYFFSAIMITWNIVAFYFVSNDELKEVYDPEK